MATVDVGAYLDGVARDRRIIPHDFDWREFDEDPVFDKIYPAAHFMDGVIDSFLTPEMAQGELYPWDKAQKVGMRFRPQEVTLYSGHSGSYKSITQSQIALHLMSQDVRCLIASFEMAPKKTLARAVRQAAAAEEPPVPYMRKFKDWSNGRLWLFDHLGDVESRKVLAVCRYAVQELGCTHLFIDSLMKVLEKTDDYNEQKAFVGKLCSLAKAHNCHVHLVAHSRKRGDGFERIGKHDIHGASEMEKQADNVLVIQRNLKRDDGGTEDRAGGRRGNSGSLGLSEPEPDVWLSVEKQRDGAFEGSFGMGFDSDALCLTDQRGLKQRKLELGA